MRRVVVPPNQPPKQLSPGVTLGQFYPGGSAGPHGEVQADHPGGQAWTDVVMLGTDKDAFQVTLPDIRMPANQYWPLHWHDCWIAVVLLEGQCMVGDWWMKPGDVLVTAAELEYGPLLVGPQGCRLFEIFAKHHLGLGGYAPEYRDHPTLQGVTVAFKARSALNARNNGRQCLPLGGVAGVFKGHLSPGAQWDLGEKTDPDRAVMKDTRLKPGERVTPHHYDDWHFIVVLDGAMQIGSKKAEKDAFLLIQPKSRVDEIVAGPSGAQLFELSRTAAGMPRIAP